MDRNLCIARYYNENFNLLRKRLSKPAGSLENAEDVVQEAYYRAIKYWDSFKGNTYGEIGPWFSTILSRTLKDFLHTERLYGGTDKDPEEELGGSQEEHFITKESITKINNVIQLKKSPVKEVLTLYYLKGKKPREISQILDLPNKTIRMCVLRFKEKLNVLLEDCGV